MAAKQPQESEIPQIVNLSQVNVDTVHADLVRASRTTVRQLEAEEAELQTCAAGVVNVGNLRAQDTIMGSVVSGQATVVDSIVAGVNTDTIDFEGVSVLVVASNLGAEEIKSLVLIADHVQAGSINTGILLSREVHGNVNTTLDGQTALMVGLVGGAVAGLILLTGKMLFGRKN